MRAADRRDVEKLFIEQKLNRSIFRSVKLRKEELFEVLIVPNSLDIELSGGNLEIVMILICNLPKFRTFLTSEYRAG